MLNIYLSDKKIQYINEINDICTTNQIPVFILGCGIYGDIVAEYLKVMGITTIIGYTVDDEYITEEQIQKGVIRFSEYLEKYSKISPLVFGIYDYDAIIRKKEQYKSLISHMYDFHIAVVNGKRVDWNSGYVMDNYDKFEHTYNMLTSEKSRLTMNAYINAAVAGEFHDLYVNYRDEVPYFNEKLVGQKIDRLFDCGAFDGDSAHDFIRFFQNYEHIYEFEPDISNVSKIINRVKNEEIRDLSIIEKGVWSETTTLRFSSEGKSSSSLSDKGDVTIDVMKLDDMYDRFTPSSLIKMDIEGSELEALKGSAKVISEISPYLAICVYHKREDLITIPQYIESLVDSGVYEYHIGFQGLDLAELVFYAIPKR